MSTSAAALSEKPAILRDTAMALRIAQMEGLREKMDTLRATHENHIPTRINPFTHEDRIDSWEICKILIGLILVPLRLLGFVFFLSTALVFLKISILGIDTQQEPITGWRIGLQYVVNKTLLRASLFCLGLAYFNVKGKLSNDVRCVVAGPHSTWVDGFILTTLLNIGSPVAKREAATGLMGAAMHSAQAILVDRKSAEGKKGAMQAIINRITSPLPWRHVFIFPEGTCTNRKCLINFKVGAFAPGKPVQPVLLRWDRNVNFNPTWTSGGPNRTLLMLRFLCQVYVKVDIEFMDLYIPNAEEQTNAALYALNVRKVMAEQLGVPVTEHSYEDSFMAALAHKRKLDPEASLPHEFVQLSKLHNISYDDASRLLKRFAAGKKLQQNTRYRRNGNMQISDVNSIGLQDFAKLLGLPLTDAVIDFFYYLDVTGEGQVDFPAFLIGLSFLSQQNNVEQCAKLVWAALEQEIGDRVEVRKLQVALDRVFQRTKKRTLPLFREHKSSTITYEEFVQLLKLHPEYMPLALQFMEDESTQFAAKRLSVATANTKLSEKQTAYRNALAMESYQDPENLNSHKPLEENKEDSLA